jgi:hypothetical protein
MRCGFALIRSAASTTVSSSGAPVGAGRAQPLVDDAGDEFLERLARL